VRQSDREGHSCSIEGATVHRSITVHAAARSNVAQIGKTGLVTAFASIRRPLWIGFNPALRAERRRSRTYPPTGYAGLADFEDREEDAHLQGFVSRCASGCASKRLARQKPIPRQFLFGWRPTKAFRPGLSPSGDASDHPFLAWRSNG
jgi:hypothetical protein